ncbi:MAG: SDR family oxidoreductase [Gallionella sp.]
MKRILIVGCGDIARRTIPKLIAHYRVFVLLRKVDRCVEFRNLGAIPIRGDLDNRRSLSRLAGIADAVFHFAPPPSGGAGDRRTRNLLAVLSKGPLPTQLIYISTSGVYGDCAGSWVSETQPAQPTSERGQRRLNAEQQIRDWARRSAVQACILRVPGIYAAERLPIARIKQGSPCIMAAEDSYTNHIHADDLAAIIIAALHRGQSCRVYHASDHSQLKRGAYFDAVADAYHLPRAPRLSRAEAQQVLSPMMMSFMNESRRLTNVRIKQELNVHLRYPTVSDFLAGMNPERSGCHAIVGAPH